MPETFTIDSFAEKAAESVQNGILEEIVPKVYELVPKETVDQINAILKKFSEDPERTANAVSTILHGKKTSSIDSETAHQTPVYADPSILKRNQQQTQQYKPTDPTEADNVNVSEPAPLTVDEAYNSIFEKVYFVMKDNEALIGNFTISDLIAEIETDKERAKELLRPYFNDILGLNNEQQE